MFHNFGSATSVNTIHTDNGESFEMKPQLETSLLRRYINIFLTVSLYWTASISLVFLNKHLFSGDPNISDDSNLEAPLFITWYQCIVTLVLFCICSQVAKWMPHIIAFPEVEFDQKTAMKVMPLSFMFVAMITGNNLCLKYVGVTFYNVSRSLSTVFNVICSYIVLGQTTSIAAIMCCMVIIGGFLLGLSEEDVAGTLSVWGVIFGVLSSMFVALNAIYTKKVLPAVGDNIWSLTFYNNVNAVLLFLPLMMLNGDFGVVYDFENLYSPIFWLMMTQSGVFGFVMAFVTGLQIKMTSPLTHNISGTSKGAAQTVLASWWYSDLKSVLWWISNITVLFGSAAYTYVKQREMRIQIEKMEQNIAFDCEKKDPSSAIHKT